MSRIFLSLSVLLSLGQNPFYEMLVLLRKREVILRAYPCCCWLPVSSRSTQQKHRTTGGQKIKSPPIIQELAVMCITLSQKSLKQFHPSPPFVLSLRKNLRIYTYGKRNRKTASQVCSPPDSVQDGDSESLYNADPCWLSVVIAQPIVVIDILKSCFKK